MKFGKESPKKLHFSIFRANSFGGKELFSSPFPQKLFYSPLGGGGSDLAGILISERKVPLMPGL